MLSDNRMDTADNPISASMLLSMSERLARIKANTLNRCPGDEAKKAAQQLGDLIPTLDLTHVHSVKVKNRLPKGRGTVLWWLGDKFQEYWWKSGRKLSPKNVSWVGILLCSSWLLLQPLLHPTADAGLLWLSRMSVHFTRMTLMSVHAPPVSARTQLWRVPTHTHPLSFFSREDTKYQRGGTGSDRPPVTRVISLLFLCVLIIHRLISALRD